MLKIEKKFSGAHSHFSRPTPYPYVPTF